MHEHDDVTSDEQEPTEGYCVHCRMTVEMEDAVPVWTRRGTPGTRGICPVCGSTVFRMGRTEAHLLMARPDLSQMRELAGPARRGRSAGSTRSAVYLNYTHSDADFAGRLAADLNKMGVSTWAGDDTEVFEEVSWAGGVHPALEECSQMIVVLSRRALESDDVEENWRFFRDRRKPVVIAQVEACQVPDELRTRPRYDFGADYRTAFRDLIQALSG